MKDIHRFRLVYFNETGQEYQLVMSSNFHKSTSNIILNKTRLNIYAYLCKYPCSHLTGIARNLKMTPPTIDYHLKKMLGEHLVCSQNIGKKTVFFPEGMVASEDISLLALLNDFKAKMIFNTISNSPNLMQKEICRILQFNYGTVRWYSAKLRNAGLIEIIKDGVCKRYLPTNLLKSKTELYKKRSKKYKDHLIDNFIMDGLYPRIIKSETDKFIIQIGTGILDYKLQLKLNPFSMNGYT